MDYKPRSMKKLMVLITFGVVLIWFFYNLGKILGFAGDIIRILSPFIIGLGIAFLFNKPMMFIENKLFSNVKDSFRRPLSYSITLILFILLVFIILFLVIPELINTVEELGDEIPKYLLNLESFLQEKFKAKNRIIESAKSLDWSNLQSKSISFLEDSWKKWVKDSFSFASSLIGGLLTFGLAFVFSAYSLLEKEKLLFQSKKLILASFPRKISSKIFYIGKLFNEAFSGFISGKLRESLVIIVLFFTLMTLFKFPYPLLISIMIGVLTLIPWFGAFIGFFLGFILIFVIDRKMAFWFIVLFLALYQIEGNFIYPIVVGKASDLSSIWIFVAGVIGGSIGGLVGILLSIPIFSVLASLLSEWIDNRLDLKGISNISKDKK